MSAMGSGHFIGTLREGKLIGRSLVRVAELHLY